MTAPCQNCGSPLGDGCPPSPSHCGNCPPWRCEDCGETCSSTALCSCWVSLDGMALADIKGLLALGDLSVNPDRGGAA